jgi:alpha-1,2-mannosyltransferase
MWGTSLTVLSWFVYVHTMMVPGYIDRAGRFKGTDYIYFYVMGSLISEGRAGALYEPDAHLAEGRRRIDPQLNLYAPYSNYGPQVAAAFAPLSRLPFGTSLAVFLILTACAYAASVWLVWRFSPALGPYGALVAILAAGSPAFFTLIRYAQLSGLSLLLLSLALVALVRDRRFLAGIAIGLLVFKPQLGVVIALVMILSGEWRIVSGAAVAASAELAGAWLVGGSSVMKQYGGVLVTLARDPSLVQIYPGEVHSLRGFVHLLTGSPVVVSAASVLAVVAAVWIGVRTWKSEMGLTMKWGLMVLLTVLASPHLLTYDLILLAIPLLVFAGWAVAHRDHPLQPWVGRLLLLLYLAPFSSNLVRLVPLQLSVVVMVLLVWAVIRVSRGFAVRGLAGSPSSGPLD